MDAENFWGVRKMVTEYEFNELRRELRMIRQRLARLEESLGQEDIASSTTESPPPPPMPEWTPVEPAQETSSPTPAVNEPVEKSPAVPDLTDNILQSKLEALQKSAEPVAKKTLEQFIGLKGMLIFGVGFLLLACVFFFKYAYDRGWIVPTPPVRCLIGMIAGLVMLGIGEWTLRKKARLFAAAMFAGGVVLLYLTAWAASPNGLFYPKYEILGTKQAFAAMCCITLIGVLLAVRANMITGGVIALVGAFATPFLLSSGENRQIELMSYLLAVDVGFLVLATLKRWPALVPVALAGTVILFFSWFGKFGTDTPKSQLWTLIFSWSFTLLFMAWAVIVQKNRRVNSYFGIAVVAASSCFFTGIWLIMYLNDDMAFAVFAANLLALDLIVILLSQVLGWHWIRLGVLAWTGLSMFAIYNCSDDIFGPGQDPAVKSAWQITWLSWAWGFFALMTIDILTRAARKFASASRFAAPLDAGLALAATALVTAATYFCGSDLFPDWLGRVILVMAVVAIGISEAFRKRKGHEFLQASYLVQGLGLLTIAVPIQFDNAAVPMMWMGLGLISMVQARRLKDIVMLLYPPVTIILAVLHFCLSVLPDDPSMRELCFSVGELGFTNAFVVATGLALGMLVIAVILHIGRPVLKAEHERTLAAVICFAAAVFFGVMAVRELPLIQATWAWLIAAVLVLVTGLAVRARAEWSIGMTSLLLTAAAFKWMLADTLGLYGGEIQEHSWIVLNPIFLAGLGISAGFLLLPVIARRFNLPLTPKLIITMVLTAATLVAWAGSFEVVRYVDTHTQSLADPGKALQMGLSIWWSLWATIMLIIGMAMRAPAGRYFAIVLYGITATKVLLVDMRGIDAIYRILSFLVLGILLAAGSWAYYKFFKDVMAKFEER